MQVTQVYPKVKSAYRLIFWHLSQTSFSSYIKNFPFPTLREKQSYVLSYDSEGKELFDGYSCEVVLADSCNIATHLDVYVGDLTKPTRRLEHASVPNVISAIDYLKKGWTVTFCKDGAEFRRDKK